MTRSILAVALAMVMAGIVPMAADTPAPPLIAEGCAGCHGQSGAGMGQIPRIAGYDRTEFIHVWQEFRDDARPATVMNRIARGYTDEEIATLADYFSTLEAEQ